MLRSVLSCDVGDELVTAVVLEVQVDVGHFVALNVEEALKDQAVFQRVDVRDSETVEDNAARGASPHPEQDPVLSGIGADVHDD